jgi:hypothetical protein
MPKAIAKPMKGSDMLRELNKDQAHFIALLARVARLQRDNLLGNVAEKDLGGTRASRGEHNPTALLAFEPLPWDAEQLTALREAISSLTPNGRAAGTPSGRRVSFSLSRSSRTRCLIPSLACRAWKRCSIRFS